VPDRKGHYTNIADTTQLEIQEDKDVLEIAKHDVFYVCACSQIGNRFGCLINDKKESGCLLNRHPLRVMLCG
jgi:hypothetical protein